MSATNLKPKPYDSKEIFYLQSNEKQTEDSKMSVYKKMREEYKPKKICVLFIGESPPKPKFTHGKLPHLYYPYFYSEKEDASRRLYGKIANALELPKPKSLGLKEFEKRGMWLTDIFDEPLEKVEPETVEAHLNRLFQEKEANPSKIVTLLPKSKRKRGNDVLPYFLRKQFHKIKMLHTNPWSENQEQFKKRLTEFLKN